jgi:acetyl esterase
MRPTPAHARIDQVPLDPQLDGVLALLDVLGRSRLDLSSPAAARRSLREATVDVRLLDAGVPVGRVTDERMRGPRGPLAVRTYHPGGRRSVRRPTIVTFHGGGFVLGDLDTHDTLCRWLCREVDAVVVSVAYGLAPEDPFPAAVEDASAATRWVAGRIDRLGGDASRLVVAGDSAGGNLAAVVAQSWRHEIARGRPPLAAQVLLYPVVDLEDDDGARYPSRVEFGDDLLLTGDDLRWFAAHYLAASEDRRDPRLSPINGDLEGSPPTVLVTAEFDPLRDEAEAYADALEAAGVRVTHRRFAGLVHGFAAFSAVSLACAEALEETCALVREVLDHGR